MILGTDGRKMSKNFKNYPDPAQMLEKYGGDALRLYLLGSPVMNGEDINISEEAYALQARGTMTTLWNIYNFFISYALLDNWSSSKTDTLDSESVLDQWLLSELNDTVAYVTDRFDHYNTADAIDRLKQFITDFSTLNSSPLVKSVAKVRRLISSVWETGHAGKVTAIFASSSQPIFFRSA